MARLQQELMSTLGALQKAVFSQPTEGAAYSRVTVRPVSATALK